MAKRKCGCVIADRYNTASVRHGYEMSGYIKKYWNKHKKERLKRG